MSRVIEIFIGVVVFITLFFAGFHVTTAEPLPKYGPHCHITQVGNWIGAVTVAANCEQGAP